MTTEPRIGRHDPAKPLLALAAVSLAFVAGCSSGSPAMHGSTAGAMMGAGGGYHLSPTSCTVPPTAATTVNVLLADMGATAMMGGTAPMGAHMMLRSTPGTVRPGAVTFIAANRGWRTHELVIMALSKRGAAGRRIPGADGKVAEAGALGEASTPCRAGAGSGIPSGSASWVTITLPAGRYELICNLPNHYADGMYQELDVR